jgi:hypothetical protein
MEIWYIIKQALQVREGKLFALLFVTVTDNVASNKFKRPRSCLGCLVHLKVLGQVIGTGDFDLNEASPPSNQDHFSS